MTHGSLFSGIGGFDLAAEWAGWENMFHCEWNEFGKRVLNYYWPKAESYGDITKTDFTIWRGRIDVLTGGFPCQPYSAAGKRLGKEDERHLWPEMLRAIREIQPRWVVGENVRGLTNWNGGLVFDEVQADLEAIGYQITPFLLPACAVNAPHRRDRIWFIAYSDSTGFQTQGTKQQTTRIEQYGELHRTTPDPHSSATRTPGQSGSPESNRSYNHDEQEQRRGETELDTRSHDVLRHATNTKCEGQQKPEQSKQHIELLNAERNDTQSTTSNASNEQLQRSNQHGSIGEQRTFKTNSRQLSRPVCSKWEQFPTQSPICGRDDELPSELDGITFSKWRSESVKAYGNAVVPELVYMIFKAINQYEQLP